LDGLERILSFWVSAYFQGENVRPKKTLKMKKYAKQLPVINGVIVIL